MTAAVIIGVIALISVSAMCITVTLTSRRNVSDAFHALKSFQSQSDERMGQVLDRLMTIKWEDYASVRALDDDVEGGFELPQSRREDPELDGSWGALKSRMEALDDDEQALIDEDFDNTGAPRRADL